MSCSVVCIISNEISQPEFGTQQTPKTLRDYWLAPVAVGLPFFFRVIYGQTSLASHPRHPAGSFLFRLRVREFGTWHSTVPDSPACVAAIESILEIMFFIARRSRLLVQPSRIFSLKGQAEHQFHDAMVKQRSRPSIPNAIVQASKW